MNIGEVLQGLVLALILATALGSVLRQLSPVLWRRLSRVAATTVLRYPRAPSSWRRHALNTLNHAANSAQGCGSGCSSCNACGIAPRHSAAPPPSGDRPARFKS